VRIHGTASKTDTVVFPPEAHSFPHPLPCLPFPGRLLAVPSPTSVAYSCPQLDNTWSPDPFTLQLTVSAGRAGCGGQASATASVTITDKPAVQVTAKSSLAKICEDEPATTVNVTFTAVADNGVSLDVPPKITASDGRICKLRDSSTCTWPS
jgi:hypothetical protein